MKEWILKHTEIDEEKYDKLINYKTVKKENLECTEDLTKYKNYKLTNDHPFYKIDSFTYKKPTNLRCILFGIKKDQNVYIYKDIKFMILAEEIFENKNDPYKNSFYSKDRKGTCFEKSLDLCFNINNSKIVTAMCDEPFIKPAIRIIHSFVTITKEDGKEYVLDGTFNVIIEKETYLKLLNAEIISEIESKILVQDIELLQSLEVGNLISVSEYLCFPKQVSEGVKKYIKTR